LVTIQPYGLVGTPARTHTDHVPSLSRRWTALLVVLVMSGALVGWRLWPRDYGPVAPALTSARLLRLEHLVHGQVVVVGGGSQRDAHTLWSRYRDQPATGVPATKPRLVGISLVRITGSHFADISEKTWWVVYTDHVWGMPAGSGSPGFGKTVILVDPITLRAAGRSWQF
jgi:hypothetical protein